MKIKFLSLCATAFLLFGSVQAQSDEKESGGLLIKAGINMANVTYSEDGAVDDARQTTSFHGGIVMDMSLVRNFISFQPGIIFSGKGSKLQSGDPSTPNYYKETFNPYYIEIPANLVIKLPIGGGNRIFGGAGPYLGIGVGGKTKVDAKLFGIGYNTEAKIQYSDDDPTTLDQDEGAAYDVLRRFDYGLNGTAGIETRNHITVGVNYGYGLAKILSGTNSNADDANKHRVLSFWVGFKF